MHKARVNNTYTILELDEDGCVVPDGGSSDIHIEQFEGDMLEVWKERSDGFLFVYCNRLEIGYWVLPGHVTKL